MRAAILFPLFHRHAVHVNLTQRHLVQPNVCSWLRGGGASRAFRGGIAGICTKRCGYHRRQFPGATGDVAWGKRHDQRNCWPERAATCAVRGSKGLLFPIRVCLTPLGNVQNNECTSTRDACESEFRCDVATLFYCIVSTRSSALQYFIRPRRQSAKLSSPYTRRCYGSLSQYTLLNLFYLPLCYTFQSCSSHDRMSSKPRLQPLH